MMRSSTAPRIQHDATVKFDQELSLTLERDAHVIVAAIGEKSKLVEFTAQNFNRILQFVRDSSRAKPTIGNCSNEERCGSQRLGF